MNGIDDLKYILNCVPDSAWMELRDQINENLDLKDILKKDVLKKSPKDHEIIKFVCMSSPFFPSFVVFEKHLEKGKIDIVQKNIRRIKKEILEQLDVPIKDVELYLFNWDEVPGKDNGRLIEFLKQEFSISWVENAKIEKTDNFTNITVTAGKNYLSLRLNNEKTKVNLEINGGRSAEFIAKNENGKLNIYIEFISLFFAGRDLKNEETLSEKGVAYTDKVYFYLHLNFKKMDIWYKKEEIKDRLKKLNEIDKILTDEPELYGNLSESLYLCIEQNRMDITDEIWKIILILRNFAGFIRTNVDKDRQKDIALNSTRHLLKTLEIIKDLDSNDKYIIQYNVVNILEWLAYRYPKVFGDEKGEYKDVDCEKNPIIHDIGRQFVCNLSEIIKNEKSPPALKLETAWAFSWAGTSHQHFASYIVSSIKKIIVTNFDIPESLKRGLIVALLRSTVIRFIYREAGKPEKLGGFNALSARIALSVTEAAIEDKEQLDSLFEGVELTTEFLYGASILYSIAGDHSTAADYFERSSKINDQFWRCYRKGLADIENAESKCDYIEDAIQLLSGSIEHFENAQKANKQQYDENTDEFKHGELLVEFRKALCNARIIFLTGVEQWRSENSGELNKSIESFEEAQNLYSKTIISKYDTLSYSERTLIECYCLFSKILKNIIKYYLYKEYYDKTFSFKNDLSKLMNKSKKTYRFNLKNDFNNKLNELNFSEKSIDVNNVSKLVKIFNDSFSNIISACPLESLPEILINLLPEQMENVFPYPESKTIYILKGQPLHFKVKLAFPGDSDKIHRLKNYKFIKIIEANKNYNQDFKINPDKLYLEETLDFNKSITNNEELILKAKFIPFNKNYCELSFGQETIKAEVISKKQIYDYTNSPFRPCAVYDNFRWGFCIKEKNNRFIYEGLNSILFIPPINREALDIPQLKELFDEPLFNWNEFPVGKDNLTNYLKSKIESDWVESTEFNKIDKNNIKIFDKNNNYLDLKLDDKKNKVFLKFDNGTTYDFILKQNNGSPLIYSNDFNVLNLQKESIEDICRKIYSNKYIIFEATELDFDTMFLLGYSAGLKKIYFLFNRLQYTENKIKKFFLYNSFEPYNNEGKILATFRNYQLKNPMEYQLKESAGYHNIGFKCLCFQNCLYSEKVKIERYDTSKETKSGTISLIFAEENISLAKGIKDRILSLNLLPNDSLLGNTENDFRNACENIKRSEYVVMILNLQSDDEQNEFIKAEMAILAGLSLAFGKRMIITENNLDKFISKVDNLICNYSSDDELSKIIELFISKKKITEIKETINYKKPLVIKMPRNSKNFSTKPNGPFTIIEKQINISGGTFEGDVGIDINKNQYSLIPLSELAKIFEISKWDEENTKRIENIEKSLKGNEQAIKEAHSYIQELVEKDGNFKSKLYDFATNLPVNVAGGVIANAIWKVLGM